VTLALLLEALAEKQEGTKNIDWQLGPSSVMPSGAERSSSCLSDYSGEWKRGEGLVRGLS
jgi:hypothetical protein